MSEYHPQSPNPDGRWQSALDLPLALMDRLAGYEVRSQEASVVVLQAIEKLGRRSAGTDPHRQLILEAWRNQCDAWIAALQPDGQPDHGSPDP